MRIYSLNGPGRLGRWPRPRESSTDVMVDCQLPILDEDFAKHQPGDELRVYSVSGGRGAGLSRRPPTPESGRRRYEPQRASSAAPARTGNPTGASRPIRYPTVPNLGVKIQAGMAGFTSSQRTPTTAICGGGPFAQHDLSGETHPACPGRRPGSGAQRSRRIPHSPPTMSPCPKVGMHP